jgi:hypothetical protein
MMCDGETMHTEFLEENHCNAKEDGMIIFLRKVVRMGVDVTGS